LTDVLKRGKHEFGRKGLWTRDLAMFDENAGKSVKRIAKYKNKKR
jgi:hypothetical protein